MKNSRKSQIIFFIILTLLFVGFSVTNHGGYGGTIGSGLVTSFVFAILAIVAMIYLLVNCRKKLLAVIVDFFAVVVGVKLIANRIAFIASAIEAQGSGYTVDEQSLDLLWGIENGLTFTILIVLIALLIMLVASFIPKGYFAKSATCSVCGKKVGLNRYKVAKATDGSYIWQCQDCAKRNKGKLLKIDLDAGKAEVVPTQDTEVKVKCNTCGHVYCYNLSDLQRNRQLAKGAVMDSVLGVTEAVGGTRIGSQIANARAESKLDKVVDYSRCPHCHSTDVRTISKEEWNAEKAKRNSTAISYADELKKYKELLDLGVISQEEFDAKKKQLLGL